MITDDPGTPGNRRWEISVAYTTDRSQGSVESGTPLIDIHYGYGERLQFAVSVPWLMTNSDDGGRKQGLGDACVGAKWRFLDRGEGNLAMSIAPAFAFNTSRKSVTSGLVDSDAVFFLPVQASQSFGGLTVSADFGYEFHRVGANQLLYGVMVGHEFSNGIEAALEYHVNTAMDTDEKERLLNFGMRFRLQEGRTFLVSYGRGLGRAPRGDAPWVGYVGLQFNF